MFKTMNIFIRTDASESIGSGHVMRCLTLADAFKNNGANVFFICRKFSGNMISFIENRDFYVYSLTSNSYDTTHGYQHTLKHIDWLGVSFEEDAHETLIILREPTIECDLLIVDHYSLDYRWETLVRPFVKKIMVIDDLADRCHDCDFLLDQNYYHNMNNRYESLVPEYCQLLLGPKYAILRPEFIDIRKNQRKRDGNIHRVLVFFGGSDLFNETAKALRGLQLIDNDNIFIDVVVGEMNPHRNDIKHICSEISNCTFNCQISNMAELMNSADLMIGAGGSTIWERCCMGLPGIVAGIADNQFEMADNLAEIGVIYYLGISSTTSIYSYQHALMAFIQSPWMTRMLSEKGTALVNGHGCKRVISTMIFPEISLRFANTEDLLSIYKWRNSPESLRYSFNHNPIGLEDHKKWYFSKLADPDCILMIGIDKKENESIGVLRFDLRNNIAVISVYLAPNHHGKGLGSFLIKKGSNWVKKNLPHINRIDAEIIQNNSASLNAFKKAGYQISHSTYSINMQTIESYN